MSDYKLDPLGLENRGLAAGDGEIIDPIGLLTFGFIFSCYSPFVPGSSNVISTTWTQSAGITTTTWTGSTGFYGPC